MVSPAVPDPAIPARERSEFDGPVEEAAPLPWTLRSLMAALLACGVVCIGVAQVDLPPAPRTGHPPAAVADTPSPASAPADGAVAPAAIPPRAP